MLRQMGLEYMKTTQKMKGKFRESYLLCNWPQLNFAGSAKQSTNLLSSKRVLRDAVNGRRAVASADVC
jgi:hypothetical protein